MPKRDRTCARGTRCRSPRSTLPTNIDVRCDSVGSHSTCAMSTSNESPRLKSLPVRGMKFTLRRQQRGRRQRRAQRQVDLVGDEAGRAARVDAVVAVDAGRVDRGRRPRRACSPPAPGCRPGTPSRSGRAVLREAAGVRSPRRSRRRSPAERSSRDRRSRRAGPSAGCCAPAASVWARRASSAAVSTPVVTGAAASVARRSHRSAAAVAGAARACHARRDHRAAPNEHEPMATPPGDSSGAYQWAPSGGLDHRRRIDCDDNRKRASLPRCRGCKIPRRTIDWSRSRCAWRRIAVDRRVLRGRSAVLRRRAAAAARVPR